MPGSAVAVILDPYGGVRTVVGKKREIAANHKEYELCLTVPDFKVREPVAWDLIPHVVETAENYLRRWIESRNDPEFGGFIEHVTYYRLRCSRLDSRFVDLCSIAET